MLKTELVVGFDVTEALGITKYDPQVQEENDLTEKKHQTKLHKFLMGIPVYRKVYLKLNSQNKGNWPEWVTKTDENRVQNSLKPILNHLNESWYITEKLDGQSACYFTHKTKVWGFTKLRFGVCSRNIWLKTKGSNNYWRIAEKYNLKKILLDTKREMVIQGEICGPGVQSNKYKLPELDFYVFNIVDCNGNRYSYTDMRYFCEEHGLKCVPLVDAAFITKYDNMEPIQIVNSLVELSKGNSLLYARNREGIVMRLNLNTHVSLKVINPDFLLEHKE